MQTNKTSKEGSRVKAREVLKYNLTVAFYKVFARQNYGHRSLRKTDPKIYALLKHIHLAGGIAGHNIEYAIALCDHEEAESRDVRDILANVCVEFPSKARGLGLCGAERWQFTNSDIVHTRYDSEVLFFPMTDVERTRRLNSLFLRMVIARYLAQCDDNREDESGDGLGCEEKVVWNGHNISFKTFTNLIASIPSSTMKLRNLSHKDKVTGASRSSQGTMIRDKDLDLINEVCSLLKFDDRVTGQIVKKKKAEIPYEKLNFLAVRAICHFLLPFQLRIFCRKVRSKLDPQLSPQAFLEDALDIFLTYTIRDAAPVANPCSLVLFGSNRPTIKCTGSLEQDKKLFEYQQQRRKLLGQKRGEEESAFGTEVAAAV